MTCLGISWTISVAFSISTFASFSFAPTHGCWGHRAVVFCSAVFSRYRWKFCTFCCVQVRYWCWTMTSEQSKPTTSQDSIAMHMFGGTKPLDLTSVERCSRPCPSTGWLRTGFLVHELWSTIEKTPFNSQSTIIYRLYHHDFDDKIFLDDQDISTWWFTDFKCWFSHGHLAARLHHGDGGNPCFYFSGHGINRVGLRDP